MSLPHALLGLIKYRAATGYQLKQAFDRSIHFFWDATLPQIYRTLNDMESKGWLTSTFKHQEGKPSRKVYRITHAGVEELKRWLAAATELPQPRLGLLVKTFFGNQMEVGRFAAMLEQWRDHHRSLINTYEEKVVPVMDRYAKLTGAVDDVQYWDFALEFGRRYAKMNIEWCEAVMEVLGRKESEASRPLKKKQAAKRYTGKIR